MELASKWIDGLLIRRSIVEGTALGELSLFLAFITDIFNLNFVVKVLTISFSLSFQIDCHDSGTESDGDLDTEDFNERDIELSEYFFSRFIKTPFHVF